MSTCNQKLKHFHLSCHAFIALTCQRLEFSVAERLSVRWRRVGQHTHTHTPMWERLQWSWKSFRISMTPDTHPSLQTKILFFISTTMLRCFWFKCEGLSGLTWQQRRRSYLCIELLVSIGTITSGISLSSSQSRLFRSSSRSSSSGGFPLLSMSDTEDSTKSTADLRRLVLTSNSLGVTQV